MKKIIFKDFEVTFNNGIASIKGTIENSDTPFSDQEIKDMVASILQNITNVGDGYGNPISGNVNINANTVTGQQRII